MVVWFIKAQRWFDGCAKLGLCAPHLHQAIGCCHFFQIPLSLHGNREVVWIRVRPWDRQNNRSPGFRTVWILTRWLPATPLWAWLRCVGKCRYDQHTDLGRWYNGYQYVHLCDSGLRGGSRYFPDLVHCERSGWDCPVCCRGQFWWNPYPRSIQVLHRSRHGPFETTSSSGAIFQYRLCGCKSKLFTPMSQQHCSWWRNHLRWCIADGSVLRVNDTAFCQFWPVHRMNTGHGSRCRDQCWHHRGRWCQKAQRRRFFEMGRIVYAG